MTPFEYGFFYKCAELGLNEAGAQYLYKKALSGVELLGPLGLGAAGGLYNYTKNRDASRAMLTGLGTTMGSAVGGIGGLVGGGAIGGHIGNNQAIDPSQIDQNAYLTPDVQEKLQQMSNTAGGTVLGGAIGGLGGIGAGGLAGYGLADWLGSTTNPAKKKEEE